jgi:hypothetical protein
MADTQQLRGDRDRVMSQGELDQVSLCLAKSESDSRRGKLGPKPEWGGAAAALRDLLQLAFWALNARVLRKRH